MDVTVLAHEGEKVAEILVPSLTEVIRAGQIRYTLVAVAILFVLTILAVTINRLKKKTATVVPTAPFQPGVAIVPSGTTFPTPVFESWRGGSL